MEDNWIISNLTYALESWNGKLAEIWSLLLETPQTFKGGDIWRTIVTINEGIQAIGYGLLVLFFAVGVFRSTANFQDFKRPEYALRHFIYFVGAKAAITYGLELLLAVFDICRGILVVTAGSMGGMMDSATELPSEIVTAVEDVGFFASIPLWIVSLLGSLLITVLSFVLILTVYGRFFKIYMYAALAPIPLAAFASESTSATGKAFVKSYIGVCMEGVVILLACLIFSAFADSGSVVVDPEVSAVTQVWTYIAETIFNMLILVGLVKGSDHIIREMMAL